LRRPQDSTCEGTSVHASVADHPTSFDGGPAVALGYVIDEVMQCFGVRPESMSSLEGAWLLGFRCGLICGMDTRVVTKPVGVWLWFSNEKSR
jgi:hypothetical protein